MLHMMKKIITQYAGIPLLVLSSQALADHPSLNLETGAAGSIATTPARTLPAGRSSVALSMQYVNNDEISDAALKAAAGRHEHVHSTASVLETALNGAYGVTDDLTLGLRLPYVARQDLREGEHHHGGSGDQVAMRGDASGLGDLTLFGQYRFFRSADRRHHAAVILGTRFPTGDTSERGNGGTEFEVHHQPGSGAWGGLFGAAWSSSFGRLGLDASILYTLSTEGERDTDVGDAFNYNLSLAWRLQSGEGHVHEDGKRHTHGFIKHVDLVMELNGDWRDRVETAGVEENNTGGNVIYLSPGVRTAIAGGWSAYANVGLPVVEDLNGQQSEPDYRVMAGISKSF